MENQRHIQSTNFYLENASFGKDVVHTYNGLYVTA